MRILVDTNILLWSLIEPERLSVEATRALENRANVILFSVASLWEIAIKASMGRADFLVKSDGAITPQSIWDEAVASGFTLLPIGPEAALGAGALPLHHRDPFDRLIVAQAMVEPATLYTSDQQLAAYSPLVVVI